MSRVGTSTDHIWSYKICACTCDSHSIAVHYFSVLLGPTLGGRKGRVEIRNEFPTTQTLRHWLNTGTLLAGTVAMTYVDTTRVIQLLATAAENVTRNRHCQSLLIEKE